MLEGVNNYLFDMSVISDSICQDKSLSKWLEDYELNDLRREAIDLIYKHKLYSCYLALLPISLLVRYYYYRHRVGEIIKRVKL